MTTPMNNETIRRFELATAANDNNNLIFRHRQQLIFKLNFCSRLLRPSLRNLADQLLLHGARHRFDHGLAAEAEEEQGH